MTIRSIPQSANCPRALIAFPLNDPNPAMVEVVEVVVDAKDDREVVGEGGQRRKRDTESISTGKATRNDLLFLAGLVHCLFTGNAILLRLQ